MPDSSPHNARAAGGALRKLATLRFSPLDACVRVNEIIWRRIPERISSLPPLTSYGRLLHSLVLSRAERHMFLGTFFFRNRPELRLIAEIAASLSKDGEEVGIAVLGCSNGAEVYSIAYALHSAVPPVRFAVHAIDISEAAIEEARAGVYPRGRSDLVLEPVFERTTPDEMEQMFDQDGDRLRVKPWLREGITWHLGDATDPALIGALGRQQLVIANRFLCHMRPSDAETTLRAIARMVAPGGYLFVSGVDLDVRTRVALDLGWKPLPERIEALHEGDPSLRASWPLKYWGLEPIDKTRSNWQVRYAPVFQLP